jgi:tRNA(Ile)-lysidine synthase
VNSNRWQGALDEALRVISPRRRWLIGVSGGRDSVALLHLLVERGYRKLTVVHLDHGLRGRAARADAQFVARLAAKLKLECVIERADVSALAKARGISLETAARDARREFFRAAAKRKRAAGIILAHHADDQVETFLFNLLRGAGPAGLAAMRPTSALGPLKVFRPLLGVWRREIDMWLEERRIRWREDATNESAVHTRNRVRGQILPLMARSLGREVKPAIWRAAELLGAEEDWIGLLMRPAVADLESELEVRSLRDEPVAKQRRILKVWLDRGGGRADFAEIESVRSLLNPDAQGRPAKVNLSGDRHARRRNGRLWIESAPK